ncbi:MAG: PTS transporter subunit EIIC, partial [Mycoplasmataceae bacterium]|nr:PTS transporter subunit EIIC [Mycoplasmataceae bacterium]
MNLTLSKKSAVTKDEKSSRDVKGFFQKLARGLMLPISLLPMAGLALGVGASIVNNTDAGTFWNYFGMFFQQSGDVIFGNLPLLFGVSIAITFTEDSGAAGITAVAAWLVFNGAQKALIDTGLNADFALHLSYAEVLSVQGDANFAALPSDLQTAVNDAVNASSDLSLAIDNADASVYQAALSGLATQVSGDALTQNTTYFNSEGDASYKIVIFGQSMMFTTSQFTQNDGILSLNTSVFGGLVVGGTVAVAFNKWNEKQMPPVVGFWSGTRFVLSAAFVLMLPLALLTLLIWPWIGLGLYWLGIGIGSIPYGFDSFLFGFIERSLIPFGLHHVFYTPLWYTQAGGQIDPNQAIDSIAAVNFINANGGMVGTGAPVTESTTLGQALGLATDPFGQYEIAQGDQNMWFFMNDNANDWFQAGYANDYLNVNPGQYMQGKYAFMIFGLPAAGAAMTITNHGHRHHHNDQHPEHPRHHRDHEDDDDWLAHFDQPFLMPSHICIKQDFLFFPFGIPTRREDYLPRSSRKKKDKRKVLRREYCEGNWILIEISVHELSHYVHLGHDEDFF